MYNRKIQAEVTYICALSFFMFPFDPTIMYLLFHDVDLKR